MKLSLFFVLGLLTASLPVWAQTDSGLASVYADSFQGKPTASGELYNPHALTAAHRTLRFGSRLAVTNPSNGRTVTVKINDRGPWKDDRLLDLSRAAADELGLTGVQRVEVRVLRADQPDVTHLPAQPAAPDPAKFVPQAGREAYLQLGAFHAQPAALALAQSLGKKGYDPVIRQKDLYRVYLVVPQDEIHALTTRLAHDGYSSYFVASQPPPGDAVADPAVKP